MSERHRKEAESYNRQVQELQAQVEPLKRHASEVQAHVDSHREEIRIVSACPGVSECIRTVLCVMSQQVGTIFLTQRLKSCHQPCTSVQSALQLAVLQTIHWSVESGILSALFWWFAK